MSILDSNYLINYYFEEITKIPHGSYHEERISNYLVEFAKKHHLKYEQDVMYNVIIFKDASKGYEDHEPVIMQGHMDMVCEKNKDCDYDFDNDPLDLYVENHYLHARGTTLGADDGCGVCYMLALLSDENLQHPPLECIFTVQEEVGLCGAFGLDVSSLKGKRMIGLDSETEGETCTSSSGGNDLMITKQIEFVENDSPVYVLDIKGLLGGHSGECINKSRGNANKIAARILYHLLKDGIDIRLVNIHGGLKNNVIPRECQVIFASNVNYGIISNHIITYALDIKNELSISDPNLKVTLKKGEAKHCINSIDSEAIINVMYLVPNGKLDESQTIPGLTTLSLNMGIVRTHDNNVTIDISIRSPLESARNELCLQIEQISFLYDSYIEVSNPYPGWDYDPHSQLREAFKEYYFKSTGNILKEVATHGGLETGVWADKIPGIDIITFGPNMSGIHTPDETLDLDSYQRCYDILYGFIETL
ncbi:MAG: beta-Ala-His dipeptidase [Erysipelotrichaceae bacterium]|nr:beta-Ala-His dipeptidase [Erysipelotrichaceae bacterium]